MLTSVPPGLLFAFILSDHCCFDLWLFLCYVSLTCGDL